MELRHLRYFVVVGRCLNFTRAAEMLHVSQPPLSRQIREFEAEVGTPLFDRTGRKIALTEAGEYLLVEAERLLEEIGSACRTAKTIADRPRPLGIGCVNFFFSASLAPFIEEVKRQEPDLRMNIRVMPTEALITALMSGSIELCFARPWARTEGILFDPVAEEQLALVFPATFPAGTDPAACVAALSSLPFIALARSPATGLSDAIEETCADYGIAPVPAYECNDALSIISLVSAGVGWSILPAMNLRHAGAGIRSVPLPKSLVIGICHREGELSAEAQTFVALARAYFSKPEDDGTGS